METQTDRELNINQRRAVIAAGKIGHENLAADLVQYGNGQDGLHLAVAKLLWPVAYTHFDDLHHGRAVQNFHLPEVQAVYKLAREGDSTAVEVWQAAELAKRKGMGWGHYPIVKGGDNASGSKLTWKVREGDSMAKRSIIPTCPAHNAIIRKCNQILVEAESATLRVLTLASNEAERLKKMWRKRQSVRWAVFPQFSGQVVMVHSEAAEGGNELGAMCNEYGKAELYALVEKWIANKPEGARARPCQGWGKHYRLAKGHNEESLAMQAEQATAVASGKAGQFSLTALHSPYTVASALNSTVDGAGHGLDVTTSIKSDVETLLQLELVKALKPKAYANLERVEAILNGAKSEEGADKAYIKTNILCPLSALPSESEGAAEPFHLSAKPPKQRNKPLGEAVGDRLQATWAQIAAERGAAVASEVQPC